MFVGENENTIFIHSHRGRFISTSKVPAEMMKIPLKLIFTGYPSAGEKIVFFHKEKSSPWFFLQASGDDSECGFLFPCRSLFMGIKIPIIGFYLVHLLRSKSA